MTGQTYEGIPREKISWYPTILTEKCTECGACVSFCHQAVYADGPVVKNPFNCVVGCTGCASECPSEAISFPSLADLRDSLERLRKEREVLRGEHL